MADRWGFLARLINDICSEVGATLTIHDEFGRFGTIAFPNGKSARFKGTSFDINPLGAYKISDDKDYTATLLRSAGLNAPEGRVVVSPTYREKLASYSQAVADQWDPFGDAKAALAAFGLPVFIKPNIGSEGIGVHKVNSEDQALAHLQLLFQRCDTVLIQPPLPGRDFRLVFLDQDLRVAYERVPFGVIGDGASPLRALIEVHASKVVEQGRALNMSALLPQIGERLVALGLDPDDVPENGKRLALLDNANLSTGGHAVDVLETVDPRYVDVCRKAMEVAGLRLCGVDLLCRDISSFDEDHTILELNASPGLQNFHAGCPGRRDDLRELYRDVILAMQG